MKAPDGGHVDGRIYAHSHMDIGRASRYEQAGRQAGLRILAAIAGARRAEQSAFRAVVVRRQAEQSAFRAMVVRRQAHVGLLSPQRVRGP